MRSNPSRGMPNLWRRYRPPYRSSEGEATVFFVADQLAGFRDSARAALGHRLLDLVTSKKALVIRVQRDIVYRKLLKSWLSLHLPLSIALLAALTVHVVTVFFYW